MVVLVLILLIMNLASLVYGIYAGRRRSVNISGRAKVTIERNQYVRTFKCPMSGLAYGLYGLYTLSANARRRLLKVAASSQNGACPAFAIV